MAALRLLRLMQLGLVARHVAQVVTADNWAVVFARCTAAEGRLVPNLARQAVRCRLATSSGNSGTARPKVGCAVHALIGA